MQQLPVGAKLSRAGYLEDKDVAEVIKGVRERTSAVQLPCEIEDFGLDTPASSGGGVGVFYAR